MQLPAQNVKEGVITFSLTQYAQNSVSTSKTVKNAGNWTGNVTGGPAYYKTATAKLTTANVLHSISYVLHKRNPSYYGSKATLVLVQGELSGFFNMTDPGLPEATAVPDEQGLFDTTTGGITTIDQGALFVALATGRHILPNPLTGAWPPGHHQPWGQIFVKDPNHTDPSTGGPLCENVTFFFAITVEECYDCFYLNSFITDTSFTSKSNSSSGPPCCTVPSSLLGSGADKYYMSLSFDNTSNNPYLNPSSTGYVGWGSSILDNRYYGVVGIDLLPPTLPADGIDPDLLPYSDIIRSGLGIASPYEMRFTLQGIMHYSWNLKFINTGDAFADFVGSASFSARGFGFIALFCSLLDGGANGAAMGIAEGIKKASACCVDDPWYDSWYGIGWNQPQDPWSTFGTNLGLGVAGFDTPVNTQSDLSFHTSYDQDYYPGWEWGTNPTSDTLRDTPLDADHPSTFIPIWSEPTLAPTTSVSVVPSAK